tara:strand:+ start:2783 stop:3346 length:564 start_codon:yes stop_codon:yes gene_type:complete
MPISKIQSDSLTAGVGGKVLQVVLGKLTTGFTDTGVAGTFPADNYFVSPGLEATITPQFSNSQILITTHVYAGMTSTNSGYQLEYQILKGGAILTAANGATTDGRLGVAARANYYTAANATHRTFVMSGQHLDPNVATTSATKYEIRVRAYSGNPVVYINRSETFQDGNNDFDGIPQSTITLTEIAV